MALTHGRLLDVWRERAVSGQVEARRVLAEMLTPSGGNRANCYKFISWVTGCSNTTIGKVNEQMKNTGTCFCLLPVFYFLLFFSIYGHIMNIYIMILFNLFELSFL